VSKSFFVNVSFSKVSIQYHLWIVPYEEFNFSLFKSAFVVRIDLFRLFSILFSIVPLLIVYFI
jgi:hypothetical protein